MSRIYGTADALAMVAQRARATSATVAAEIQALLADLTALQSSWVGGQSEPFARAIEDLRRQRDQLTAELETLARLIAGAHDAYTVAESVARESLAAEEVDLLACWGLKRRTFSPAAVQRLWSEGSPDGPVPLGLALPSGDVVSVPFKSHDHLLIAGASRSGKSELLRSHVISSALSRSPSALEVALIDLKFGEIAEELATLPHVTRVEINLEDAGAFLDDLVDWANAAKRVDDAFSLHPPARLVVIDELGWLLREVPQAERRLAELAALRDLRIVAATQRATAVSSNLLNRFTNRIALRMFDPHESVEFIGDVTPASFELPGVGLALFSDTHEPVRFRAASTRGYGDVLRTIASTVSSQPPRDYE